MHDDEQKPDTGRFVSATAGTAPDKRNRRIREKVIMRLQFVIVEDLKMLKIFLVGIEIPLRFLNAVSAAFIEKGIGNA